MDPPPSSLELIKNFIKKISVSSSSHRPWKEIEILSAVWGWGRGGYSPPFWCNDIIGEDSPWGLVVELVNEDPPRFLRDRLTIHLREGSRESLIRKHPHTRVRAEYKLLKLGVYRF